MKNNWQTKKIGDILKLEYGKPLPRTNREQNGKYAVYGANGIKSRSNDYFCDKPSIIVGRKGSAGEINYTEDKFWPLDVTYYITFDSKKYDLNFIYYLLSLQNLTKLAKGVKPGINRNDVYSIEVEVPKSLHQQQHIVEVLDEAFEKINKTKENVKKNLQKSKELFNSYLNSIFTNPKREYEKEKIVNIGKVSMCRRIFKDQTNKIKGIPFYKIGTFGKEPDAFISNKIYNEFRTRYPFPKKGDVLISASGTIGRRVRYDGKPAYFQDSNIVWVDNNEKKILNDYLYYFYGSCDWNLTKGATISRLYNKDFEQLEVIFPKSILEQQKIIKKLDNLSEKTKKLEEIYKQKINALDELKKSILGKAFRGEL